MSDARDLLKAPQEKPRTYEQRNSQGDLHGDEDPLHRIARGNLRTVAVCKRLRKSATRAAQRRKDTTKQRGGQRSGE